MTNGDQDREAQEEIRRYRSMAKASSSVIKERAKILQETLEMSAEDSLLAAFLENLGWSCVERHVMRLTAAVPLPPEEPPQEPERRILRP